MLSECLRQAVAQKSAYLMLSQTCIVPFIVGENLQAVEKAQNLQKQGYYCLPIRPPTVPKGTARLRFSLTANMTMAELDAFIQHL